MENNCKIKNIIFDLGEVLINGIKNTGLVLKEKHKIEDTLFDSKLGLIKIKSPLLIPLVDELFIGNIDEDEYIKNVLRQYPQLGTEDWLKKHIRENFIEVKGTREIIIKLRNLGYKTAILSINGREWIEYCEKKFDFHKLFDVYSYSFEDKVLKPNPLAFQKVLHKLNAKPEECVFIDDQEKNIKAAQALGIKSVLFINTEDLQSRLKQIIPNF